jgi:hypothetical protein
MIMLLQALIKVLKRPAYATLALCVSGTVFVFFVWLPNLRLLWSFFQSEATITEKLHLALNLLSSISTNFSLLSASYTITIAILFGIYVALLVYFLRKRIAEASQGNLVAGGGIVGIISGIFGVGCAICGSFILTTILGFTGASAVLAFLPLKGGEFGILGVTLLLIAIYFTARRIQSPAICIT